MAGGGGGCRGPNQQWMPLLICFFFCLFKNIWNEVGFLLTDNLKYQSLFLDVQKYSNQGFLQSTITCSGHLWKKSHSYFKETMHSYLLHVYTESWLEFKEKVIFIFLINLYCIIPQIEIYTLLQKNNQIISNYKKESFNLGIIDILGQIILCYWGAVLCIVGFCNHQMPVTPSPSSQL